MSILTVTTTADTGTGSLREVIKLAKTGDTIKISADLANKTLVLRNGQFTISAGKNLTIDAGNAPGFTISGNKSSRLFLVNSNQDFPTSLTLKNIQLTNGYTREQGGAIYVTHKGGLTVENVTFKQNVAVQGGGAIHSAWETNLTAIKSKFINNDGAGANKEIAGGAISFVSPGKILVRQSEFTGNRGINGGAIYSLQGKLTIEDSKFIGNDTTAGRYDTNQKNPFLRGYGGAVYTDRASAPKDPGGTITINNSIFKNNKALGEGGAAYLYTGTNDRVVINGSLFENNQVSALKGGTSGHGGAIVQLTNGKNKGFTIANSAFINNRAESQGGAVWMEGATTKVLNSTFSRNSVSDPDGGRGGAMMLYSDTNIDNTTIAYNEVEWFGGGIARGSKANVSISDSIFVGNKANNVWGIRQHVQLPLIDKGGNFQYPPESNSSYNVTNVIKTDVNPQLGQLGNNGGIIPIYPVNNPIAKNSGAQKTFVSLSGAASKLASLETVNVSDTFALNDGIDRSGLSSDSLVSFSTGVTSTDELLASNSNRPWDLSTLSKSQEVASLGDDVVYGSSNQTFLSSSPTLGLDVNSTVWEPVSNDWSVNNFSGENS